MPQRSSPLVRAAAPAIAGAVLVALLAGPAVSQDEPAPLLNAEITEERLAEIEAGDPDAGRITAQRCAACHSFAEGDDTARTGPLLFGVVGRAIAAVEDFGYTPALAALGETGAEWTVARLELFLTDPAEAVPGTAMAIDLDENPEERANIIAYLMTLGFDEELGIDRALARRLLDANPDDGELLAGRCTGCHTFEEGGDTLVGPNLYDIVGAPVGRTAGFDYSLAFRSLNVVAATWTYDRLDAYLANPQAEIPGTRMGFGGIDGDGQRAAIIAWLRTLSDNPIPLPGQAANGGATRGVYQEGLTPLTFTNTQVSFGSRYYSQLGCGRCHAGNLAGMEDGGAGGTALYGTLFERNWFGENVYTLYRYIETEMPFEFDLSNRGVDDDFLVTIVAFILARSGFVPGDVPMPQDRGELAAMGFYQ